MSVIKKKFKWLAENNESALIAYITAGYPTLDDSIRYIKEIILGGADMIEIGIPFSDPIADGRTIQYASNIALKNGVNLSKTLNRISNLKIEMPVIIMSYLNPINAYGIEQFFKRASESGISGVIIPDLVVEESYRLKGLARKNAIDLIQLVAPTTNDERIRMIGEYSDSFVYCVAVTGTTGVRKRLPATLPLFIKRVKSLTEKPVVVGFGISRVNQIKALSILADGIVVGSRLIEAIKKGENLCRLIKKFKNATIKQLL
ncbi:MAG: tryptophan synthase subunit alpha [candidate division WOR-3 bacterium]